MHPSKLAELLGVEHSVIQAPMAGGATTPAMVAAVSNAGALGSFAAAYLSPAEIADGVAEVRRLTSRPFAVNLFAGGRATTPGGDHGAMRALLRRHADALGLAPPELPAELPDPFPAQMAAVLDAAPAAFSFAFGVPDAATISALRARGTVLLGTATTVREARALEAAGVDVVVAQGAEAGGHRGTFMGPSDAGLVGTMALVPQVVDAVALPVVAAGGIMDARGAAAARALGAAGVQVGTAFLACDESGVPEALKRLLLAAGEDATTVTSAWTGRAARGLANALAREIDGAGIPVPPFPFQQALTRELRAAAAERGDASRAVQLAGQGLRLLRRRPAAEIVAELVGGTARHG
ncbi:MAG TPA: nitronate monooxygenase [Gemmatimonadaceae bacterium]|nr:nitronate monooxygenase [Gemmatimonadaceae bacterium]